ncbi:MAG: TldD/PmbA family protein [Sorangiineae bacterium]|nr:TldD/PmbA family protein [Polyangiaceae bacterium]MEB2321614.1 TldD/PmbA family protein [Sorangiineae bacterium]
MNESDGDALTELCAQVVERARARGAEVAEASARAGWELSTRVRLGEPELVEEAGHRGVSLRVIKEQRVALTSTSDLSPEGLERCVADALMLAELSQPDAAAGPAEPSALAQPPHPALELYDPRTGAIDASEALRRARDAERAALDFDPRITLSEGATFSRSESTGVMVLSSGFTARVTGSYASLVVSPVVEDEGGKRRRGHYWTGARYLADLEDTLEVGREAARRTLAKLGARKVPTCEAPVVFDPDVARSLIGTFAGCITGGAVWRKSSYLVDRVGTVVASPLVTLIDDPLIPRALGSRAFDGEGLRSRRNVVVKDGVLETFLLDCYSARKLGLESTASAHRSGGSISAGTTNFTMQAGAMSRDELIASTGRGLYVTEMMGFGFNPLTGDYSRGAAGFWIEDGQLAFPVSEITVSSSLDSMLKGVDAVASDLELKTSTAAPTFRVASMTIAGT